MITIHLGTNPSRGGMPPKDSITKKIVPRIHGLETLVKLLRLTGPFKENL